MGVQPPQVQQIQNNCLDEQMQLDFKKYESAQNEIIIKDFLKNYRNYKRELLKVSQKPSKIIVDYLF